MLLRKDAQVIVSLKRLEELEKIEEAINMGDYHPNKHTIIRFEHEKDDTEWYEWECGKYYRVNNEEIDKAMLKENNILETRNLDLRIEIDQLKDQLNKKKSWF